MTEAEWLASGDSGSMGLLLHDRGGSPRKLRLYAVACCRRLQLQLLQPICARAIDLSEMFADGGSVGQELSDAQEMVNDLQRSHPITPVAQDYALSAITDTASPYESLPKLVAAECVVQALAMAAAKAAESAQYDAVHGATVLQEGRAQATLLRCVFGNPFRPVAFADSWRSETAVALASAIYSERAFDRMPILADALEEAGCDHPDVLTHCRGPGPHTRGCWVVDRVLGKE
jgi:hypothetical protein